MAIVLLGFLPLAIAASAIALHSHLHKRHPYSGSLLNASGVVETPLTPQGSILIDGELWLACSASGKPIPTRSKVNVVRIQEHLLLVASA